VAANSSILFVEATWDLESLKVSFILQCAKSFDHHLGHVPGTVLLNEKAAHTEALTGLLKHGTGQNAHIVLAPQPSEDPNDPLNWPRPVKELNLFILAFGATLHAAVSV